ncbi:hypothetical protein ACJIZ3_015534 [Penstemon smallii]|uniref:Bifunctional inhibitor/plant lipid transfer protein/seed storage helical domain-containing protein n=1 Tax=Penstemon smallii TaxID=265156 RepID=A0ABD3RQQ6_9LAMI
MSRYTPRFIKPNENCCVNARKANIKLFCNIFFIAETEKIFSPAKVVKIAKYCKKPLPFGTKCGNYSIHTSHGSKFGL